MKAFVIVATKGRPKETFTLLDYLAAQTFPIEKIVIVGSEASDVNGLETHPLAAQQKVTIKISEAGSCVQRNVGLDEVLALTKSVDANDWFVVFFDDDFRPANNWIESSVNFLNVRADVVGLSGWVLADGAMIGSISEGESKNILTGSSFSLKSPRFGDMREASGLYGCNMAYRGIAVVHTRFDENLPLYGWQEDVDFGARASKFGKLYYIKTCKGVHLGASTGRTSGVRFGYSQIANPIYLIKKGTVPKKFALRLIARNVASNTLRAITLNQSKDYFGRLKGNLLAIFDLLTLRCHPKNILKIGK